MTDGHDGDGAVKFGPPARESGADSPGPGAGAPGAQARAPEGADPAKALPAGADRPRLTSRAAVLAVVMCAIALSLAYPVREYIAQHRQIAQLQAQHEMEQAQVRSLQAEQRHLTDPRYIEQQAQARLNMCMRDATCYAIINGRPGSGLPQPPHARRSAWYVTLWNSVQQADRGAGKTR